MNMYIVLLRAVLTCVHHIIQPEYLVGWLHLAGSSKEFKIFLPWLLAMKVDQNIIFPETYFAYTISETEIKVYPLHKNLLVLASNFDLLLCTLAECH